jgi:radical SAM superfamily enzyme YgiQ (UPF0313 family)
MLAGILSGAPGTRQDLFSAFSAGVPIARQSSYAGASAVRVGILTVFVDYHRRGAHHRGVLQPQIGPLLAALLPAWVDVEVINDSWEDPDWSRDYDLLFISALHSDFDRARQISHFWRHRGATTVFGGRFASAYPELCAPWFDSIVIGEPEDTVPRLFEDFVRGDLKPRYRARAGLPLAPPTPRVELLADRQVLPLALEVTRGCPFACNFCVLAGSGERFVTRPVGSVVEDLVRLRAIVRDRVPWYRRSLFVFLDNNIGGHPRYLRELALALQPLRIRWGSCITFNAASNAELVGTLARSGCRFLYVGLESFNPATLTRMNKRHNVVQNTREMIRLCHRHGILLDAGLMLSPDSDDLSYIAAIPHLLDDCGLIVPSYVCFETPIPGTPLFSQMASATPPRLLPNALLRDFTTYTLVTQPRHSSATEFVDAYRRLTAAVFAPSRRARKLAADAWRLLPAGGAFAWSIDVVDQKSQQYRPDATRSYLAGSDRPPPEAQQIPFGEADFRDADEYTAVMAPTAVTDAGGHVLPIWLHPHSHLSLQRRSAAHAMPQRATTPADDFPPSNQAEP